ncbi:MAG: UPF0147 family protein [Candidatus Diapherotrites archaeon]
MKDVQSEVKSVLELMDAILDDSSVPRNIRAAVEASKEKVSHIPEDHSVNLSSAIYLLDDVSNDINMPSHTRTEIWSIISALEAIKEKIK